MAWEVGGLMHRWSKWTYQERFFTNNWYISFCQFLYKCPTNHTIPAFDFKSWNVICGKLEKKEQKIIDWKGPENYKTECRKWGAQSRKKTSLKTKRRNKTFIWERRKHDCSIFNYKRWALTYCKRTKWTSQPLVQICFIQSLPPISVKENTIPSEHLYFHCTGLKCDWQ